MPGSAVDQAGLYGTQAHQVWGLLLCVSSPRASRALDSLERVAAQTEKGEMDTECGGSSGARRPLRALLEAMGSC